MPRVAERVLDTSVILAILFKEAGCEAALAESGDAAVSANIVAEVATKLADNGQPIADIISIIASFALEIHSVDADDALEIAWMRDATRRAGLSLGDRSCLVLAKRLGLPAVTADRSWSTIAKAVGVDVRLIR